LKWYREGYMSCTGKCFDIGITVQAALKTFENTRQPFCGSTDPMSAGNGSLMRLAPVPLFYGNNPALAIEKAGQSSQTTHGAKEAVDACRYFAALIIGAVAGKSREEILNSSYPDRKLWAADPLAPRIAEIAAGSYKRKGPKEVRGNGYVVNSLEAALWAFDQSTNFRDGALLAVNLGDDADTTGAIYGQLAGAFYGEQGIPEEWRLVLADRDLIEHFAEDIYSLSLGVLAHS
jgi:ADP-ribosyl-[dinitrogen reductase] hydrolase